MNMDDIKAKAVVDANEIEIDWEQLENPNYRADFEHVLKRAIEFIPELEGMYGKLTTGQSVVAPGENTSLSYDDIEQYTGLIAEELYSGYILQELHHKYEMVNAVINADRNNPLDNAD
jgi:hypothetical protein